MGSKRLTPTRVGKNGLKMFVVVVVVVVGIYVQVLYVAVLL